ncbi:AraC family transcriptional regulator ligand-binding domain-containing protein (plasmid) [Aliisedimentitalea scapharcae]|uniref:AraC family transcriptional regulator ligand-binding domain-containing protein n=1 Tax=Aliisedimentitalea scapharcae TaxID=1524259 RepID=A0ABZ2Y2B0_9RHOB
MPDFVRENLGARALDKAYTAASLSHEFVEENADYLPEVSLANFIAEIGREVGAKNIGLMWSPSLTVLDYGNWGKYVLSAATLGEALTRANKAMPLHSSTDRTTFRFEGQNAYYGYKFGLRQHSTYPDIAFSALGSVLSIFRNFLGNNWRPMSINCDFPEVSVPDDAEITFGCPVHWNTQTLEICFRIADLKTTAKPRAQSPVTLADLKRQYLPCIPQTYVETVTAVLQQHFDTQGISLERTARALDIGERSLQRYLMTEGVNFRSVSRRVKIVRAKELLREKQLTVQQVAIDLGYDNPQNFTRAFKNETGIPPGRYAKQSNN